MKLRTLFAFVLFLFVSFLHAQEGIYYQAAIRNTDGSPIRNTTVNLQLSILENETIRFEENHELETNSNGIIHTTISSGEVITGEWNAIDWSQNLSLKETILLDGAIITESIRPILKAPRAYVADKALSLATSSIHAAHVVNETLSNNHIASNAQIAFDKLAISREDIEDLGIISTAYSAGENITISDSGEISALDTNTEYTAGSNITINEDGVISATDTDTNTTYSAGNNITINDENVISATDIDTNTTYTLGFEGTTLSLTDSEGHITSFDLSSLDTDTNTTYSSGTNISISESGEISSVDTNTEYTAGANINITEDGVISAIDTDTTYSAGLNITISEEGVISATDTDTNTEYTAGSNVSIDANNVISSIDTNTTYSAGTNITIDENIISSVDTDTNTTYTLTLEQSTLTLTDSEGNSTAIDLSGLDTDTNTTYSAGTNVTIDENGEISSVDTNTEYTAGANININEDGVISATDTDTNTTYTAGTNITIDSDNIISATDTDTTYSAGSGIEINNETISIDATVVTSNFQGSVTANAFVGDGSGLTNLSIPNDAITTSKIADASITSDKIDSSVDYTSSYSVANATMTGANSGYVLSITNSSTTGNSSSNPLYIMGKGSITNWGPAEIDIPAEYTLTENSLVYITRTSIDYQYDRSAILIGELDVVNNKLSVSPSADTGTVNTTFNFMIVNFDY